MLWYAQLSRYVSIRNARVPRQRFHDSAILIVRMKFSVCHGQAADSRPAGGATQVQPGHMGNISDRRDG